MVADVTTAGMFVLTCIDSSPWRFLYPAVKSMAERRRQLKGNAILLDFARICRIAGRNDLVEGGTSAYGAIVRSALAVDADGCREGAAGGIRLLA